MPLDDSPMQTVYARKDADGRLDQSTDANCCHIGTAIIYPVSDQVKPSFVIFDIRTL